MSCGSTPSAKTPAAISTSIQTIYTNRYNAGYTAGNVQYYIANCANAAHGTVLTVAATNMQGTTVNNPNNTSYDAYCPNAGSYTVYYMVYCPNTTYGIGVAIYKNNSKGNNSAMSAGTPSIGKFTVSVAEGDDIRFKAWTTNNQSQKVYARVVMIPE